LESDSRERVNIPVCPANSRKSSDWYNSTVYLISESGTQIVGDQNYLITILRFTRPVSTSLLNTNQKKFILTIDAHGAICVYRGDLLDYGRTVTTSAGSYR